MTDAETLQLKMSQRHANFHSARVGVGTRSALAFSYLGGGKRCSTAWGVSPRTETAGSFEELEMLELSGRYEVELRI